jgi:hypothetical protein
MSFVIGGTQKAAPFWGDLHNHNGIGYGKGSLERSYAIARGGGLDVFAFTPHGHWHDLPQEDPKIAQGHLDGFELVRQRWPEVVARANAENRDGAFTCFVAVEWHSSQFGDYHILFPGERGEVCRAGTLAEAQEFVRQHGAIMIPHHIAYRQGWRGINWEAYRADVSPVLDVFSEHGNGMEPETHWPYVLHSMGGSEKSQTALEQLKRGRIFGLTASTDNHGGHPASYAEGLVGIWSEKLTRQSVFEAIRNRHTYAVTGDRIELKFHLGEAMMGDIVSPSTPRRLRYEAVALGAVDYVQVLKNGTPAHHFARIDQPDLTDRSFCVRIEFGWDGMSSPEVTEWTIQVRVNGGDLQEIIPCFAGGRGSYEKINRVASLSAQEATIEAYTCRLNSRPTSGAVLRLAGIPATQIAVDASAQYKGASCGCRLAGTIAELQQKTLCSEILRFFSAPKISLGLARGESETRIAGEWTDPAPGADDWYLLKLQQQNGHIAWSSPIWCTERRP